MIIIKTSYNNSSGHFELDYSYGIKIISLLNVVMLEPPGQ